MADEVKQQAEADVVMRDTSAQPAVQDEQKKAADKIKTRKEAIAEQKFVREVLKRNSRGGKLDKDQRKQLKQKVLKRLIEAKA